MKKQLIAVLMTVLMLAGTADVQADMVLEPMGVFSFSVGIDGNFDFTTEYAQVDCSYGEAYIGCVCDADSHDIQTTYQIEAAADCPFDMELERIAREENKTGSHLTESYNIICTPKDLPLTAGIYPFTWKVTARCGSYTGWAECMLDLIVWTPESDLTWTINGDEVTITGYTGSADRLMLPAWIDGLPVKAIGSEAFYDCEAEITSVYLPDGIATIGEDAFYGCSALKEIRFPPTLYKIGDYAFAECDALTSIALPEGMNVVPNGAFNSCDSLKVADLPSTIKTVGLAAFGGCSALKEIMLPAGVTSVGENAFANCAGLESVALPESLISIGAGAFSGCVSLSGVDLPDALLAIGGSAFKGCESLQSITLPAGMTVISEMTFMGCDALTQVNIPVNITEIARYAFSSCEGLQSAVIAQGVQTIGEHAFGGCQALTNIEFSEGLTYISPLALKNSYAAVATVDRDSYAYTWCVDNNVPYVFRGEQAESTPTPVPQPDEDGIYSFDGHYYKAFTARFTWEQCVDMCEEMGGYLVTITSQQEQDFINVMKPDISPWLGFWIGGYRDAQHNWYWVTEEPWVYTCWGEDEPNNGYDEPGHYEPEGEDRACLWPEEWNDLEHDSELAFICEWNEKPILTVPTTPEPTPSPTPSPEMNRNDAAEFGGHQYKILTGEYTWDEAFVLCEGMGGHLATITSASEQNFVELINVHDLNLWIGGYRDEMLNWHWITGEQWDYTNWGDGEPNNMYDEGEDCAVIWPELWNDLNRENTSEQVGFVCEWEEESDVAPDPECEVVLPGALKSIGIEAFSGSGAQVFIVGEECLRIESRAFADCANLIKITLPESVIEIEDDAFDGCTDFMIVAPKGSYAITYAQRIGCGYVQTE